MDFFHYKNDKLYAEDCPITRLAEEFGTPLYVYSKATLERHWHAFDNALGDYPHLICFAVKSNSNIAVLQTMARLGSGFDIVSQGELERVLTAGGEPTPYLDKDRQWIQPDTAVSGSDARAVQFFAVHAAP